LAVAYRIGTSYSIIDIVPLKNIPFFSQLPASCMSGENPKIETLIQLGTTLQKLMRERKQKVNLQRCAK
jgi:hypothetical protein